MIKNNVIYCIGCCVLFYSSFLTANNIPESFSLNYQQRALSNSANPSAPAYIIRQRNNNKIPGLVSGVMFNLAAGVSYGNIDNLFELIDDSAEAIDPDNPDNPDDDGGWDLGDIEITDPDVVDLLKKAGKEAAILGGTLALIGIEGYARAYVETDLSFVINENLWGGVLTSGIKATGSSKALGIIDSFNFDKEQAQSNLEAIYHLTPQDPETSIDLTGGFNLVIDPSTGKVRMTVKNDSFLLTKAAKIAQFKASFSKAILNHKGGNLYFGATPVFYRIGLTRINHRIGDIKDSELLFEEIKNSKFIYKNGVDINLGLTWSGKNFHLGASLLDVFESKYRYPELDPRRYKDPDIINLIKQDEYYAIERQLKINYAYLSPKRHWAFTTDIDVNSKTEPMGDKYQWVAFSANYTDESWWLPGLRVGLSKNFSGSQLSYVNLGATLFNYLNVDIATTLDQVDIKGDKFVRGAYINLGFQIPY